MAGAEIVKRLLAEREGMAVCWTGNAGWLVRGSGKLVAFDLDVDSPDRAVKAPVTSADLAGKLDALFATHDHGDHFHDLTAQALARNSQCLFVLPASCIATARSIGLPDARIVVARPRVGLEVAGLPVEPTHAFHGHRHLTVHKDANRDDCGYIVTVGGRRVFHPGDSVLTEDHLAMTGVDVLFVSPTDHNMRVGPAAQLIGALRPGWIFPQHYGTYRVTKDTDFWTVGYPDELRAALGAELQPRFHKLAQGEIFVIPPR